MEKHPYEELIETVADKMKEHEDDNLGFGIFEKWTKIWDCHEEPHGMPVHGKNIATSGLVIFRDTQLSRTTDII